MKQLFLSLCGLSLGILAPSSAFALTFDEAGLPTFDPKATASESFETLPEQAGLTFKTGAETLMGTRYAYVNASAGGGGARPSITIPLKTPAEKRAYHAAFFARTNRVVADVSVQYGADDKGSPSFNARFFPTGRVTSDGWYEVATNRFSIDGTRNPTVSLSVFASGAGIDAFELVPDGAFKALDACTTPAKNTCGTGEYCAAASWCRNGDITVPPLPIGERRNNLVSYLSSRLMNFFGGRHTREDRLPIALKTLEGMRYAPTAWDFWNGYATAIHQLHDWHTAINGVTETGGRGAFPICVVEGDADLSHDLAPKDPILPDVLVSHVGPDGNSGLAPGDRIVAINGMHPIAFAESLENVYWGAWRSNDPAGHAEAVERLYYLIRRWAETLTIIRCDHAAQTCSAPQTLKISDLPTTEPSVYPACDHRPGYHLAEGNPDPVTHHQTNADNIAFGLLKDSADGEDLYGAIWDDVLIEDPSTNPYIPMITAFHDKAKGVVLDHRTGNGGTEPAAEYLTTLVRLPEKLGVASGFNGTVGWFDAPFTKDDGLSIFNRLSTTWEAYDVGAADARTDMRTALLLARDGSASDWFPEGMKGIPNVRSFGRRTAGAFSSFFQFDYYGGLSWQFGSGDYIRKDGTTHIGEGVLPDEDLLPKQSDLIVGKDTVYERALTWVRTGQ